MPLASNRLMRGSLREKTKKEKEAEKAKKRKERAKKSREKKKALKKPKKDKVVKKTTCNQENEVVTITAIQPVSQPAPPVVQPATQNLILSEPQTSINRQENEPTPARSLTSLTDADFDAMTAEELHDFNVSMILRAIENSKVCCVDVDSKKGGHFVSNEELRQINLQGRILSCI